VADTQRTMWSVRVIALTPAFHDHPRLVQRIEALAVERCIPQFSVEGFDISLLPRTPWLDTQRRDGELLVPLSKHPGNTRWTIIGPDMRRAAPEQKQLSRVG
jgi:hypothetical protein